MKRVRYVPLIALAFVLKAPAAALADQHYEVSGSDSFTIGAGDIRSEVSYQGTETLSMRHKGTLTRYAAHVDYTRSDQGAAATATGDYVCDVAADGDQVDAADHDPDYLTVLNQPFSVQLDGATLRDIRALRVPLPFDFPSPFTASSLHGSLERITGGPLGSHRTVGVRFTAGGPMHGSLPDRPGLVLVGTIAMRGTAYYDLDSALLLVLDATVTISGKLSDRHDADPVTIVYRRVMRADGPH